MNQQRPKTRSRNDSGEPEDDPPPSLVSGTWTRHPELWLAGGNIVLVCETTGFCVAQCILRLHSEVLDGMFETVDPAHGETFEGLPIARLQDSADDMYHLLKAMHLRQYIHQNSKPAFEILAIVLKLSSKYMIDDLRREIIATLTKIFPSSLSSFIDGKSSYRPSDVDAMYAVELAKQYNVPIILPVACYLASMYTIKEIMDSTSVASVATRCISAVSREQLMNIVDRTLRDSRAADESLYKKLSLFQGEEPVFPCIADRCTLVDAGWLESVEQALRRLQYVPEDPLGLFELSLGSLDTAGNEVCKAFTRRRRQYWDEVRSKIWDALPLLCGFEDWAAVKATQKALTGDEGQADSLSDGDDSLSGSDSD